MACPTAIRHGGGVHGAGQPHPPAHPISTLPPDNLLNITLFSYAGELSFGLIATDALPNLERLGDYVTEAFTELERSVRDAHA